jgi:hypothetical protein
MHTASLTRLAAPPRRAAYAVLTAALLTLAIVQLVDGAPLWQFFAFGAAADLALFAGIGTGLAKGQLHPRAVPLYNALHRFAGPILLAFLPGLQLAATAWALHIALDRSLGYGLRTRDGFQRA